MRLMSKTAAFAVKAYTNTEGQIVGVELEKISSNYFIFLK